MCFWRLLRFVAGIVDRCCARRRCAAPFVDVAAAELGVFGGGGKVFGRLAAGDRLLEQLLQKRPAPAAAGPRAETVAELRGPFRLLHAEVVDHLPLGDVKAETEFFIQVQRFNPRGLVGVEKSLVEKVTTVIRYDEFNGKTKVVKMANDKWDNVWGYWLYFICITFLSIVFFFGKQLQGNYLLLNSFYVGLGLLIPLFFLRYIKSEVVIFYNKEDNGIFWLNVNSANREKLNQIVDFVKGKVESQT